MLWPFPWQNQLHILASWDFSEISKKRRLAHRLSCCDWFYQNGTCCDTVIPTETLLISNTKIMDIIGYQQLLTGISMDIHQLISVDIHFTLISEIEGSLWNMIPMESVDNMLNATPPAIRNVTSLQRYPRRTVLCSTSILWHQQWRTLIFWVDSWAAE